MPSNFLSTLRSLFISQSTAAGRQTLDLTAYPLLISSPDPEGVFKVIDVQRKDAVTIILTSTLTQLLALFAIQATIEDKVGASITCALACLALTLRVYLEGVPTPTVQGRVHAMGLRKFAVINAIPSWGTVLMSVWMIGRFIPYPFLTFATIITAVVMSVCMRAVWTKVVNMRASVGSQVDASPV